MVSLARPAYLRGVEPCQRENDITFKTSNCYLLNILQRDGAVFAPKRRDGARGFHYSRQMLHDVIHVFHRVAPEQKVFFIDTGYHFPETLAYKQLLTTLFELDVVEIRAESWKHEFTRKDQTWKTDPNFCCSINKVEPLDAMQSNFQVWISGLMSWQTEHRESLDVFEERNGILKFYPLIDVTKEQREEYIRTHKLPFHPLVANGYNSIGCAQCTKPGEDRSGRWNNCPKTECGLHL